MTRPATSPARVNARRLLNNALNGGWRGACLNLLAALAGDVGPYAHEAQLIRRLPADFAFADLRDKVTADQLLDVIDALECDDMALTSGNLLYLMAAKFFLPQLPAERPGYAETCSLMAVFHDYLVGKVKAEAYIGAAYNYRSDYGTTVTAAGTDSEYELLFDAMPAVGLDGPAGEGCWHLGRHWRTFGRFLAARRDEWRLLDDIDAQLDEVALLDDVAASLEAAAAVRTQIVDLQREVLVEIELDALGDALDALIEVFFPAAPNTEGR